VRRVTDSSPAGNDQLIRRELAREAVTMALYVSMTLLATLVAIPSDDVPGTLGTAALIWGGSAGLALAHWVAFDVAGRIYRTPHLDRLLRLGGPVSVAAALAVAFATTIPLLLAPEERASETAAVVLVFILAGAGVAVSRRGGAGLMRSFLGGLIVLGVAGVVVAIKIAIQA
jgi:hypothetical protein